jgi:N-acyl-D-amino-acid deacylase
LQVGFFADVAIFDPASIQDHASFSEPHQHSSGMQHVIVNGVPVLRGGELTGNLSGRFVKGPGYSEN